MEGIVGIAQTVERDLYTVKAAGSMPALNTQGTYGSLENKVFYCASGARTPPSDEDERVFVEGERVIYKVLIAQHGRASGR
jgi:hypothetical protein